MLPSHSDSPQPTSVEASTTSPSIHSTPSRRIIGATIARNAVATKHRRTQAAVLLTSEDTNDSPMPPLISRQLDVSTTSQSCTRTTISPTSDIPGSTCLQSAEQITTSDIRSQGAKIHAPMPKKSHISKLLGWGIYIASQTRSSSTDLLGHNADIKVSSDPSAPGDNLHFPTNPIPIVRSATAPPNNTAEDDDRTHASARTSSDSIAGRPSGLLSSTHEFSDAENELSGAATLEGTYYSLNTPSPPTTLSGGSMAESPSRASVSTIRAIQNNVAELDVFSPGYPTITWPSVFSNNASSSSSEPPTSSSPNTPANGIPMLVPKHPMPDSSSLTRSSSSSTIHSAHQQTATLPSAGPQSGLVLERKTKFGYSPIKPKKRDLAATLTQTVRDLEMQCEEYALEVARLKSELETSEKQRKNATEISRFLMSEWGPIPSEQEQLRVDIADGFTSASPGIEATMHNLQGQVAHLTNALQLVTQVVFGEEFDILPDQSIPPAFPEDKDTGSVTTRWDQLFSLIRRKSTTRSALTSPATGSAGPNSQDGSS
ncbi:hypothetical protein PILCRDRAFT_171388 [Piloderma croceum F 1598]|uniref:Uncharacterized protein n=1 Tax=Piloderma croceum (strain F 1598) TaxID=765440 RepID=A0A0C3GHG3_PILCF|nr:hypothetical protein PILCRDRAFT_171388 [Piloderma croceum F 1598]